MVSEDERRRWWDLVERRLPAELDDLRPALQHRTLSAIEDPLRNRLIRKLLRGFDTERLNALFRNARVVLTNWSAFTQRITTRTGRIFDKELWPWYAEVRGLDFLCRERGVTSATALLAGTDPTPEFITRRSTGDGLAEVKRASPNDNYNAMEEEFEIAVLRSPDLFRHLFDIQTPDDRAASVSSESAAVAAFMKKVHEALGAGHSTVQHDWRPATGPPCSLRVQIKPADEFMLMGSSDPFAITDESARYWLDPYEGRLRDKARKALRQMLAYAARTGMKCVEKDVVIFYDEPGASYASLFRPDDINRIKQTIMAELRAEDPTVTLSVRS